MPTSGGLADRVAILEKIVEGQGGIGEQVALLTGEVTQLCGRVEQLTGRVEDLRTQFLTFRGDTAAEFPAVRGEMKAEFAAVREEMRTEFTRIRDDIKNGGDETRREMRILHEDVIARIALLQEGLNGRRFRTRRPRKG